MASNLADSNEEIFKMWQTLLITFAVNLVSTASNSNLFQTYNVLTCYGRPME